MGQYSWVKNKSHYKGYFKNGLRHGLGIWVQVGDKYEGHYLNDKKNGKGTFTWASGNNYNGSYFDDMRHGYGEMHWADGSWYKGQWKDGVQNGVGQTYQLGQPPRRGVFENNVLICEEDTSKKLKVERVFKKSEMLRNRNYTNYDLKMTKLPDDEEFNKRLPSFTIKKPTSTKNKTATRINRHMDL